MARLVPPGDASGAEVGASLATRGSCLVAGAPGGEACGRDGCVAGGAAHVFKLQDDTWVHTATLTDHAPLSGAVDVFEPDESGWSRRAVLKGDPSDSGDRFRSALAFGGEALYVGAPGQALCGADAAPTPDDDGCPRAGAVTRFDLVAGQWSVAAFRKGSVARAAQQFGAAVAVTAGGFVVGVPGDGSCRADAPEESGCFESGRAELRARP